ncbi:MAG: type II toxin-antitoxin system VapB family antitoxin [Armatimonadetes bacterium]|nr:type II toxin-antitoxin system VapB family antitoxin [Armatimonadota bacterium]
MRTTVVIDDALMKELMELSGKKTKKAAIEEAMREYIARRRRDALLSLLGNFDLGFTAEDLEQMRDV